MATVACHPTACKNCRRRGRKCDRTLPTCMSCERRGTTCEGYVTRWPGVAARGKLAGQSIPIAGKAKNSTTVVYGGNPADTGCHADGQSSPVSNHGLIADMAAVEVDELVQHYVQDLSSIFYLGSGSSRNPLSEYVLPLVDSVPPIRYALAASAACHMSTRTADSALSEKSLRLRVHATHLLRQKLHDPAESTDQTILASILMLAQLDMCSGDCLEFETHLQAAVAVIRQQRNSNALNRYYYEQRVAWLDILSSTTSTRPLFFTAGELRTAFSRFETSGRREWSYDVFPCPVDLCEMLLNLCLLFKSLSRPHPDPEARSFEVITEARNTIHQLQEWELFPKPTCHDTLRYHLVEGWRFGIMAYAMRLFPSANNIAIKPPAAIAKQVLFHAEQIPPTTTQSYSLLWPIFQAGILLDEGSSAEKGLITRRLEIALSTVGCRHFSNALDTLRFVWNNSDQHDTSGTGTFGRTIVLG